jgi:hypothetical protein
MNSQNEEYEMNSTTYDRVLEEIQHLTPEERHQLLNEITPSLATSRPRLHPPVNPTPPNGISPFIAFLHTAEPIRPEALDVMERVINDELEVVDPDGE